MKFLSLPLLIAFWSLAMEPIADGAESPSTPAPTPVRRGPPTPVLSPEIGADNLVTFRLRAPKASEVAVSGQWANGRTNLSRGSNDIWTVAVGPIKPGIYEYSFHVDGLTMIDPGNPAIKPMREPRTSILHLPGDPPSVHDFQDVPHGTVHQHAYQSKALGRLREMYVYTPPGYAEIRDRQWPTLYLQHGAGDNHATWVVHGKAHWILDNLIASKTAQPMVVVMMDGHAAARGTRGGFDSNTAAFEKDLLEEVLPFMEKNYRVVKEPAQRGIVGLSMGGGQSLTVGLRHPDKFAWIGGFSSATPSPDVVVKTVSDEQKRAAVKLLWIACGRDDFLLKRNEEFIAFLHDKGMPHEWELTGGGHSWPVWRGYLAQFLPKLFR